jgi:hypothetical protein
MFFMALLLTLFLLLLLVVGVLLLVVVVEAFEMKNRCDNEESKLLPPYSLGNGHSEL